MRPEGMREARRWVDQVGRRTRWVRGGRGGSGSGAGIVERKSPLVLIM